MKKLVLSFGAALFAGLAFAEVCVKPGEKVAFMGDSITQYGNGPAGYVNLVMAGLEAVGVKAEKIPAGISGHKSVQMRERLDRDVLSKKPQWMTFSCGVNDVWHGKNGVELPKYRDLVNEIFDKCADSNVNVIVLTPTMIGEDPNNDNNRKLNAYVAWLRQAAAQRKLRLADLNADMKRELAEIAKTDSSKGNKLTRDGVHMAFKGDCMMAWGVLKAMGVEESQKPQVFAAFVKTGKKAGIVEVATEPRVFTASDGGTLPYRYSEPDEKDGKYPLVIFLHGSGERGSDNKIQVMHAVPDMLKYGASHDQPFFLLAPQCANGFKWAETDWSAPNPHEFAKEPGKMMKMLIELIGETLENPRVDRSRVYVTGLSMGGYGTWDLVLRRPEWFAAAIPVCGGAAGDLKAMKDVPVWVFHGGADPTVPTSRSRAAVEQLKTLGADVIYTEYLGTGHNAWTPTYSNQSVLDWLFSRHR